ncbi:hypothetical protein RD792_004584 [Penstemon davidsonii]|uniref:Tryptophan synthase beta chain-like PALP domain-containing protein n=1 Tax=Penstemon davidsonii TaxID=160366 RepID=A0ABR0DHQ9_9LAMI|nr:hypothetical protein RD792_004584 [Penstemon davidsonii]
MIEIRPIDSPTWRGINAILGGAMAVNILKHNLGNDELVSRLLDRRWSLSSPDSKINQVTILDRKGDELYGDICFQNNTQPFLGEGMVDKNQPFPSFYIVRDDLLHPLVNGNKARKLDALLPLLEDNNVTDVVTCGGCQSAHTAAVAVSCAERGLKSHLLLRGEEPETLTGYNLVSKLYGNVVYIPRSLYANRKEMLMKHAQSIVGGNGSSLWLNDILENFSRKYATGKQFDSNVRIEKQTKVVIINEGAGDAIALPGVMRLIQYLSQDHLFGKKNPLKIVVDAGTGTTAIGLALGAICLGLPWEITAVMLADKIESYRKREQNLISEFLSNSTRPSAGLAPSGIVHWVERRLPRK